MLYEPITHHVHKQDLLFSLHQTSFSDPVLSVYTTNNLNWHILKKWVHHVLTMMMIAPVPPLSCVIMAGSSEENTTPIPRYAVAVSWCQVKQMSPSLLIKPNIFSTTCLATTALHTQEAHSSYPGVQKNWNGSKEPKSKAAVFMYLGQKDPRYHTAEVPTIFLWQPANE